MAEFDDIFSTPTPEASAEPQRITNDQFDKEAWAQKKRDERDGLFTIVDERAVEVSIDTNAFVQFLDVQSRFMRMSTNNALLVAAQCPNATKLASFDSWKEQNVDILAGEKAISIFAPGDTYTKQDGTDGRYMNVSKVFDISQTSADKKSKNISPEICFTPGLHRRHPCYNCPLARMEGNILFCFTPKCLRKDMDDAVKRR